MVPGEALGLPSSPLWRLGVWGYMESGEWWGFQGGDERDLRVHALMRNDFFGIYTDKFILLEGLENGTHQSVRKQNWDCEAGP